MDTTKCAEFGREYLECRMDKYVVTLFLHFVVPPGVCLVEPLQQSLCPLSPIAGG